MKLKKRIISMTAVLALVLSMFAGFVPALAVTVPDADDGHVMIGTIYYGGTPSLQQLLVAARTIPDGEPTSYYLATVNANWDIEWFDLVADPTRANPMADDDAEIVAKKAAITHVDWTAESEEPGQGTEEPEGPTGPAVTATASEGTVFDGVEWLIPTAALTTAATLTLKDGWQVAYIEGEKTALTVSADRREITVAAGANAFNAAAQVTKGSQVAYIGIIGYEFPARVEAIALIDSEQDAIDMFGTDPDSAWDWANQSIEGAQWLVLKYRAYEGITLTAATVTTKSGTVYTFEIPVAGVAKEAGHHFIGIEAANVTGADPDETEFAEGIYTIAVNYTYGAAGTAATFSDSVRVGDTPPNVASVSVKSATTATVTLSEDFVITHEDLEVKVNSVAQTGVEGTAPVAANTFAIASGADDTYEIVWNGALAHGQEVSIKGIGKLIGDAKTDKLDTVAPTYVSYTLDGTAKILTLTFSEAVINNTADDAALKAAVTFAKTDATTAALAAGDTVAIVDGKVVITFAAALTGLTNKVVITPAALKDAKGNATSVVSVTNIATDADTLTALKADLDKVLVATTTTTEALINTATGAKGQVGQTPADAFFATSTNLAAYKKAITDAAGKAGAIKTYVDAQKETDPTKKATQEQYNAALAALKVLIENENDAAILATNKGTLDLALAAATTTAATLNAATGAKGAVSVPVPTPADPFWAIDGNLAAYKTAIANDAGAIKTYMTAQARASEIEKATKAEYEAALDALKTLIETVNVAETFKLNKASLADALNTASTTDVLINKATGAKGAASGTPAKPADPHFAISANVTAYKNAITEAKAVQTSAIAVFLTAHAAQAPETGATEAQYTAALEALIDIITEVNTNQAFEAQRKALDKVLAGTASAAEIDTVTGAKAGNDFIANGDYIGYYLTEIMNDTGAIKTYTDARKTTENANQDQYDAAVEALQILIAQVNEKQDFATAKAKLDTAIATPNATNFNTATGATSNEVAYFAVAAIGAINVDTMYGTAITAATAETPTTEYAAIKTYQTAEASAAKATLEQYEAAITALKALIVAVNAAAANADNFAALDAALADSDNADLLNAATGAVATDDFYAYNEADYLTEYDTKVTAAKTANANIKAYVDAQQDKVNGVTGATGATTTQYTLAKAQLIIIMRTANTTVLNAAKADLNAVLAVTAIGGSGNPVTSNADYDAILAEVVSSTIEANAPTYLEAITGAKAATGAIRTYNDNKTGATKAQYEAAVAALEDLCEAVDLIVTEAAEYNTTASVAENTAAGEDIDATVISSSGALDAKVEITARDATGATYIEVAESKFKVKAPNHTGAPKTDEVTFTLTHKDFAYVTIDVEVVVTMDADTTAPTDINTTNVKITKATTSVITLVDNATATGTYWTDSGIKDGEKVVFISGAETATYTLATGDVAKLKATTSITLTLGTTAMEYTKTSGGATSTQEAFEAALTAGSAVTVKLVDASGNKSSGASVTVKAQAPAITAEIATSASGNIAAGDLVISFTDDGSDTYGTAAQTIVIKSSLGVEVKTIAVNNLVKDVTNKLYVAKANLGTDLDAEDYTIVVTATNYTDATDTGVAIDTKAPTDIDVASVEILKATTSVITLVDDGTAKDTHWADSGIKDGEKVVFVSGDETATYTLATGDVAKLKATTSITLTLGTTAMEYTKTSGGTASDSATFIGTLAAGGDVTVKLVDASGNESSGEGITVEEEAPAITAEIATSASGNIAAGDLVVSFTDDGSDTYRTAAQTIVIKSSLGATVKTIAVDNLGKNETDKLYVTKANLGTDLDAEDYTIVVTATNYTDATDTGVAIDTTPPAAPQITYTTVANANTLTTNDVITITFLEKVKMETESVKGDKDVDGTFVALTDPVASSPDSNGYALVWTITLTAGDLSNIGVGANIEIKVVADKVADVAGNEMGADYTVAVGTTLAATEG